MASEESESTPRRSRTAGSTRTRRTKAAPEASAKGEVKAAPKASVKASVKAPAKASSKAASKAAAKAPPKAEAAPAKAEPKLKAKSRAKPAAKAAAEPAPQPAPQPALEPVALPAAQPRVAAAPAPKPAPKPPREVSEAFGAGLELEVRPALRNAPKPAPQPAPRQPSQPAARPAPKPAEYVEGSSSYSSGPDDDYDDFEDDDESDIPLPPVKTQRPQSPAQPQRPAHAQNQPARPPVVIPPGPLTPEQIAELLQQPGIKLGPDGLPRRKRRGGRRRRKKGQFPEGQPQHGQPQQRSQQSQQHPQQRTHAQPQPREQHPREQPPHREQHREPHHEQHHEQHREQHYEPHVREPVELEPIPLEGEGILVKEMGGFGTLRQKATRYLPSKSDIFVPERFIQQFKLRDGSLIKGKLGRGHKHKYALNEVYTVDGKPPMEMRNLPEFRTLTSVDPDFHYAVGDVTDEVSMRILDLLCPVGRGQRGLIVAPPRSGKTTILRQFAKGIEVGYPDVHLMVLLVDERPEEATEWLRSTKGEVFVSTSDESPKNHVQVAEFVWRRAMRLVEIGQDVVLLLDSITRLARAYNNLHGGSGKTMSGGLDSKAMERPRQFFGSARNTEKAGSLTILGTTLVDTGSRMDQLIFEEFKGTGNMELVLSRRLADRRIFPAIDIEKSGTRKEEKLISSKKLRQLQILRRVLSRMHWAEAMDLLITRLTDVEKTDDFLKRFEVDPEA
jgi:transcription termination factor Rho